jgi:hypothetical protein
MSRSKFHAYIEKARPISEPDFPVIIVGQSSQSILFKPIRAIILLTIFRFLSPVAGHFAAIIAKC